MAWETDQPVIKYLERRIIYYQKEYGKYTKWAQNPKKYYNEAMAKRIISVSVFRQLAREAAYKKSMRIAEYKYAVARLKKVKPPIK